MAVRSGEAFVTVTGELASRLALAPPVGAADIGGNVSHPFRRVIGGHSHGAAVNHCKAGPGSAPRQGPAPPSPGPRPPALPEASATRRLGGQDSHVLHALWQAKPTLHAQESSFFFEAFSPCGAEQLMHAGPVHPSCYIRQLCWKLTDEEERLSPPLRGTHGCRTDLQNLWAEPSHTATGASYI